jgi:hypothetical protein
VNFCHKFRHRLFRTSVFLIIRNSSEKASESMKQVDFLKEQLRRLTIERKQLEETIGVVAGVVRF